MISVAIITYNHEKYIRFALDSVLSQNVDINDIEIVVGDDGSKDNTISILNEYAKKYSNIRVYAHENVGISKNIYEVFKACKGEFIAVLEGDDYWLDKDKLKKQIKYINDNDCIGTFSNCLIVDENNEVKEGKFHEKWHDFIATKKEVEKYQTRLLLPSTLMFKNIFKDNGDKYSVIRDASKYGGSHSGMINLLGSLGNLYYSDECLSVWRKVTTGGHNFSSMRKKDIASSHDQLNKYYIYKKEFGMNYNKQIKHEFYSCLICLSDELIDNVGKRKAIKLLVISLIRAFGHVIKRKK